MRRGQALVEFALISLLLFAILFGVIDWGMYLYKQSLFNFVVTNAARQSSVLYWSDDTKETNLQSLKTLIINNTKRIIGKNAKYPIDGYIQTSYTSGQLRVAIEKYPYIALAGGLSKVPKTLNTLAIIAVIPH